MSRLRRHSQFAFGLAALLGGGACMSDLSVGMSEALPEDELGDDPMGSRPRDAGRRDGGRDAGYGWLDSDSPWLEDGGGGFGGLPGCDPVECDVLGARPLNCASAPVCSRDATDTCRWEDCTTVILVNPVTPPAPSPTGADPAGTGRPDGTARPSGTPGTGPSGNNGGIAAPGTSPSPGGAPQTGLTPVGGAPGTGRTGNSSGTDATPAPTPPPEDPRTGSNPTISANPGVPGGSAGTSPGSGPGTLSAPTDVGEPDDGEPDAVPPPGDAEPVGPRSRSGDGERTALTPDAGVPADAGTPDAATDAGSDDAGG